jgi:hypothetical protein
MASRSTSLPLAASHDVYSELSTRENASTEQLEAAFRNLVVEGDFLDTTSEKGFHACQAFLEALEGASNELNLEPASRAYRATFTSIYRALFEGETRSFRVDMLEAGTSRGSVIWANGEEFKLSEHTVRFSRAFWEAWVELGTVLQQWISGRRGEDSDPDAERSNLCAALSHLDAMWASFEQTYVTDLMRVQSKARALVTEAVAREHWLRVVENKHRHYSIARLEQVPAYRAARQDLVVCIARLNSVANSRRKGRDDLSVDVLECAAEVLWVCKQARDPDGTAAAPMEAAELLASRVVESFQAMRSYLVQVHEHLDELLPNLCQNEGLVARLVVWEKSWEIGARHVRDSRQLSALSCFAAALRRDSAVAPALMEMVSDCDPALFMTLPRLAWLHTLAEPTGPVADLVRRQLPHLFFGDQESEEEMATPGSGGPNGEVLQALAEAFRSADQRLADAWPKGAVAPPSCMSRGTWQVFVRRAVGGAGGSMDPYAVLAPDRIEQAAGAVEGFMNELERWSMELQRQRPEDWNECVDLLVQCITGARRDELPRTFAV